MCETHGGAGSHQGGGNGGQYFYTQGNGVQRLLPQLYSTYQLFLSNSRAIYHFHDLADTILGAVNHKLKPGTSDQLMQTTKEAVRLCNAATNTRHQGEHDYTDEQRQEQKYQRALQLQQSRKLIRIVYQEINKLVDGAGIMEDG